MKYPSQFRLNPVIDHMDHGTFHIDIDQARAAIDQAEENMREAVAAFDKREQGYLAELSDYADTVKRQRDLLKRCRKAMLRVTFNRVAPGEWEHIDKGLMDALHREVHGEGE